MPPKTRKKIATSKISSVICPICAIAFSTKEKMRSHLHNVHSSQRFECEICGKTLKTKITLKNHQIQKHTNRFPYQCSYSQCGLEFQQLVHLQQHERQHSGARPYSCSICPKTFRQLSHLQQHQRSHADSRPYQCTVCSRRFTQMGNMQTHCRKVHDKNRKFVCTRCDYRFETDWGLRVHTKTCESESNMPFDVKPNIHDLIKQECELLD